MSKRVKNESTMNNDKEQINEDNEVKDVKIKISENVHSPYINTTLISPVMLYPNQMDNKIYFHLKNNLTNKLTGECYKNYGYISKIYKIDELSDGIIEPEDPTCSAKIIVKFSCKLCIPINTKELICKIDRINKVLISAINGPIKCIITIDKINKEKFFTDMNRNIRNKGSSEVLVPNIYVRILVLNSSFSDHDKTIVVIGYLQDLANELEISEYKKEIDGNNEVEEIND